MQASSVEEAGPAVGRRERKKRETRVALHLAALELFAANGFHETRISEIAEAADVSESTFFRYFDNKEGVALEGFRIGAEAIVAAVCERPLSEAPIDACLAVNRSAKIASIQPTEQDLPGFALLKQTPELAAKLSLLINKVLSQLNVDFARRMNRDAESLDVRLRAHAVIAASISSLETWIADPLNTDPQALSHAALMQLKSGL
jgi:AcrR family transcriptional regulator